MIREECSLYDRPQCSYYHYSRSSVLFGPLHSLVKSPELIMLRIFSVLCLVICCGWSLVTAERNNVSLVGESLSSENFRDFLYHRIPFLFRAFQVSNIPVLWLWIQELLHRRRYPAYARGCRLASHPSGHTCRKRRAYSAVFHKQSHNF